MALRIPPIEFDDVPMKLDCQGRAEFCKPLDAAFFVNFTAGIEANSPDEWEISSLHMEVQELRGETYRRFAQHFEEARGGDIADHVAEHLDGAIEDAEHEAREFMAA